jgi:predicted O-methyltransferase YrrM
MSTSSRTTSVATSLIAAKRSRLRCARHAYGPGTSSELDNVLLGENAELRREVASLRARVQALETSRWWRLHPRMLLRRLRRHGETAEAPAAPTTDAAAPTVAPAVARFREEVLPRGSFSEDWFTRHASAWEPVLEDLAGEEARVLEIGSFEGMSAAYLLWRLPEARITCVDTFGGGAEHRAGDMELATLESRFDANVALVDADRVEKIVGDSRERLLELIRAGRTFDLVYVDGSHLGLDVLVDGALSWQLLTPWGTLVFDDYRWDALGEDPLLRPGPAIDAFLGLVGDHAERVFAGHQVAVRKRE